VRLSPPSFVVEGVVATIRSRSPRSRRSKQRSHRQSRAIIARNLADRRAKGKDEGIESEPIKLLSDDEIQFCTTIARPTLKFSVQEALDHLCAADVRFARLRHKVGLRSFTSTSTKPLNLFQTLCTSILGQQISWLAARAILYKFTRIWWGAELPEKPDWGTLARDALPFPTPRQVLEASEESMRAAGLSFSKIRYVRGLAEKFGSGQMDVRQLLAEEDEGEIVKKLVELKGVGVWTAQMCMMFALRLPNILSHGDLGIQKGMVIWYLAGPEGPTIRADSRKAQAGTRPGEESDSTSAPTVGEADQLNAALAEASTQTRVDAVVSGDPPVDTAVVAGVVDASSGTASNARRPSADPSAMDRDVPLIPADSGLTVRILQERRNGKKIKGAYLTPAEMDSLAKAWHPYESIASLFMWSLID